MAFDFSDLGGTPVPDASAAAPAAPAAPTEPTPPANKIDLSDLGAQKVDLSSLGAKPVTPSSPAATAPTAAQPQEKDAGYWHGVWESTLGPVFDEARNNQKKLDKMPIGDKLGEAFKQAVETSPPAMLYSLTKNAISQAYDEGKKAAHHAHQALSEGTEAVKSLASGDMSSAAMHGRNAALEDSEASGHGLAAVVPIVGPAAAKAGEDIGKGKIKEGLGEGSGVIGTVVAPELAARGTAALASKVTTNASKAAELSAAEEAAATARQNATKVSEDAATANAEAEAGRSTVDAHAKAQADLTSAKQTANKAASSESAAQGKLQGATKARVSANDELAAEQIANEQRQAAAEAAQKETGARQDIARKTIINSARQTAETTLDTINKTRGEVEGAEPIDSKTAAANVQSFGDAADVIQQHAKQIYEKLDKVSDGAFTNLREVMKSNKEAIYQGDKNAPILQARLERDMDALFAKHADEVGPNDLKAASAAWRTSKVLEDLHTAVERSITGAPESIAERAGTPREVVGSQLGKRLNKLLETTPKADLDTAIGKGGVDNLYRVADLTSTPAKTAKLVDIATNVAKQLKLEAKASEAAKGEASAQAAFKEATTKRATANDALAKAEAAEQAALKAKQPTVDMQNKARLLRAQAQVAKAAAEKAEQSAAALRPPKPSTIKTIASQVTTKSAASATGAAIAHAVGADARLGAAAGMMAEQGARAVLQRMLVSPRVGKLLHDAASVGASAKTYAPLIALSIRQEDEAKAETRKKAAKKE